MDSTPHTEKVEVGEDSSMGNSQPGLKRRNTDQRQLTAQDSFISNTSNGEYKPPNGAGNGDAIHEANGKAPTVTFVGDNENEALANEGEESEVVIETRLYIRRWFQLLLFASYSACSAFQWIYLNIIGNITKRYYNESLPADEYQQQVAIDWLSMIYMASYIPFIFPATWLLTRKGLRWSGIIATFLNALGASIKCFAVNPHRFGVLMAGQTCSAIAQSFILEVPPRLAALWFGPNEVSTATAIGVFGNQFGCALGFLLPPEIVIDDPDKDVVGRRLGYMLYSTAGLAVLQCILVILLFKEKPEYPPSQAQSVAAITTDSDDFTGSLKRLLKNPGFILLTLSYGLNTGSYYAIGTVLNSIILEHFPEEITNAGRIGLTLVLAGLLGSVIAGIWLDKTKWFKATTVGIYVLSVAGMLAFSLTLMLNQIWIVFVCAFILGFFMTGYLPVGFEFAAEITYPEPESTSSGLLNASAQTFGIILTFTLSALVLKSGAITGNMTLVGALVLGTIMTAIIKPDLRRQRAGEVELEENTMIKLDPGKEYIVDKESQI
ncbi:unnamed protein product [Owenia fusiformis]|uniref:Choline/ethanolamine transporter FLVCR1 n=1 Tax=Owenia fusiformis TaxID=6347 RepID=A0A8J1T9Z5_OWEFU|nr:unnamed protein product [Owenia fusiformis]